MTDYKKSLNPIRTVKINQISYQYEVLQVLEFDPNLTLTLTLTLNVLRSLAYLGETKPFGLFFIRYD